MSSFGCFATGPSGGNVALLATTDSCVMVDAVAVLKPTTFAPSVTATSTARRNATCPLSARVTVAPCPEYPGREEQLRAPPVPAKVRRARTPVSEPEPNRRTSPRHEPRVPKGRRPRPLARSPRAPRTSSIPDLRSPQSWQDLRSYSIGLAASRDEGSLEPDHLCAGERQEILMLRRRRH